MCRSRASRRLSKNEVPDDYDCYLKEMAIRVKIKRPLNRTEMCSGKTKLRIAAILHTRSKVGRWEEIVV